MLKWFPLPKYNTVSSIIFEKRNIFNFGHKYEIFFIWDLKSDFKKFLKGFIFDVIGDLYLLNNCTLCVNWYPDWDSIK